MDGQWGVSQQIDSLFGAASLNDEQVQAHRRLNRLRNYAVHDLAGRDEADARTVIDLGSTLTQLPASEAPIAFGRLVL